MTSVLAVGAAVAWLSGVSGEAAHAQQQPAQQTPPPAAAGEQKPDADAPDESDKHDQADTHGKSGSRLFGLFPNHTAVEGATEIDPVSAGQKFKMAGLNTFDPVI